MPSSLPDQSAPAAAPTSPLVSTRRSWAVEVVRQLGWFTGIGIVMTVAYLLLYAVLRLWLGAQLSNVISWVVTAVGDTWANRRLTFGLHGRPGALRAQVEGLLVFGLGLGITSGALLALEAVTPHPARTVELAVLAAANLAAGLLRFVLLRVWVFRPGR